MIAQPHAIRNPIAAPPHISGQLPTELRGTLYRNGPGRQRFAGCHIEGDGLVRALRFAQGKAQFRSRYVHTPKWLAEGESGVQRFRTPGSLAPGGLLRNAFRQASGEASTHVILHQGELLALWEGDVPFRLDPDTLQTLGSTHFEGLLSRGRAFSAHPHVDPKTGELFNIGLEFGMRPKVHAYCAAPGGKMRGIGSFPLDHGSIVHDFALTPSHLIVVVGPVVMDALKALLGRESFFGAMRWKPEQGTQVILMPRHGGAYRELRTEAFFSWHVANAYEQGNETIVDLVTLGNYDALSRDMLSFRTSSFASHTGYQLERMRIPHGAGPIQRAPLSDLPLEFPQVRPDRVSQPHRYVYVTTNERPGDGGWFAGLACIDTETGKSEYVGFGPYCTTQEPLFVPRPGSTGERDGWLIAYVHDAERLATDVVILDAARLPEGPVCTLHLPHNEALTFHGSWIPA